MSLQRAKSRAFHLTIWQAAWAAIRRKCAVGCQWLLDNIY